MVEQPYNVFEDLIDLLDVYYDDPVAFVEDILNVEPDEWQIKVLRDIASDRLVSVRSGQGVGKTALESWVAIWFLTCRPYPKVICTAPTKQQLYEVLWAEIAKWLNNSLVKNLLKWTKTKIYMIGQEDRWFATAKTATRPENMQGFHEDNQLFICDEASGIADGIMEAILGTLSGDDNKLLMCGNPTRTSGVFFDSHNKDRADYKVHKVSSMDSTRTSEENIKMLIRKYGDGSDVCRVRVYGEFPRAEPDSFIALELVEQATELEIEPTGVTLDIGADISRFGDDETVIAPRIGMKVFDLVAHHKKDTMETTGTIVNTVRKYLAEYPHIRRVRIKVDDDGIGGGVTDRLNEIIAEEELGWEVYPIKNGAAAENAEDNEQYNNRGTELWARLRDLVQENFSEYLQEGGEPFLQLPKDDKLVSQLTTRKFKFDSKGRLMLERKEDMKKRKLPSPDRADAVVLAFAEPIKPPPVVINTERMAIEDIANAY
ncbi:terminase B [Bacillus infantis]|uniref:Terminase B n=1 Tax=Bacillus infantis TaxID=324767 RepID=A0A5D4RYK7_9BACI|nr:DEAD/DEAH box helicase family protein [Bacillus infantis]TYS55759.1 terminase B [Bacillus infantis]